MFKKLRFVVIALSLLTVLSLTGQSQNMPIAFPGAEGFGKYATGGRGGKVVIVNNLNDDGPGSLRKAIQEKGPRIIVFSLSGTIELASPLNINSGNVTVAGQSAAGDGICIKNYSVNINADNVIIRFIRFRLGDEKKYEGDAISGTKGRNNIIVDHCSMSWSVDECASFYNNSNFTLQWCIISESLNSSAHTKGEHGYGGIWGGKKATYHHNLLASHNSRLPRFSGSSTTPNGPDELVDFRNNVVYNWMQNNTYGGEKGRYNMVNNYYKPGPASKKSRNTQFVNPSSPLGKFYLDGNFMEGNEEVSKNNRLGVKADHADSTFVENPYAVETMTAEPAAKSYEAVLAYAGVSHRRDAVDARIVAEVKSGNSVSGKNKNGIIDSQNDVGGWPALASQKPGADKDRDGMPDAWEKAHNLNSSDASDACKRTIDKDYDNIEVYLNELVKAVGVR
ncbi:MAG TPA: hypothetical protein VK508_16060 [Cyclobacteriaceae bacterium]|nr:hypothetical protein [Cyclobacteriaceae bacterium]